MNTGKTALRRDFVVPLLRGKKLTTKKSDLKGPKLRVNAISRHDLNVYDEKYSCR